MSDHDYGCNAKSPEGIITVILDDAGRAKEIVSELDDLGFVIVPKSMWFRPPDDGKPNDVQ